MEIRTSALSESSPGDLRDRPFQLDVRSLNQTVVPTGVTLTYTGSIQSPKVHDIVLQATDVAWVGDQVFASYNVAGSTFLGALQVIDAKDPKNPKVVAEAIYKNTDLNRIQVAGSRIIAAGADADEGGTLEFFSFVDGKLGFDGFQPVGSYAATFVHLHGYDANVSFGDRAGGISTFDLSRASAVFTRSLPLDDARWVTAENASTLYAISGNPGKLTRFTTNLDPVGVSSTVIGGANVGAPTWASRFHDLLLVSSDEAGLLIYDLRSLSLVGQLPTQGKANGSAVTSDGKIAFLANGNEGLVMVDVLDPSKPIQLDTIDLDDRGSANAVSIQGDHLAMADGLGGVKLVHYSRTVDNPADCDGDGIPDSVDTDDDDDGALDTDDADRCNPEIVCKPGQRDQPARFVGEMYNLPCNHKDVNGPITGLVSGKKPTDYDWFDPKYYVFTIERDSLVIDYGQNYFPVDTGLCDDPFYFAAHWYTTAVATEGGTYGFDVASDDDSWLYVDGIMVKDLGGVHALVRDNVKVNLSVGAHKIDIWFAERHKVQSGLIFENTSLPSATARLSFEQHICLDATTDTDIDGAMDQVDVAPLVRPKER